MARGGIILAMDLRGPDPNPGSWDKRARQFVSGLGSRYLRWAEQNPEAVARLRLWAVDVAQAPPEQGLLGILRELFLGVAPPNWQGLPANMNFKADELMAQTGLCLVWVPEADVITQLIGASSKEERDAVLVRNSDQIFSAVERVVGEVAHPELRLLRGAAIEAVHTARAGCFGASQTLSAALLSSVLREHYGFSFGSAREAFEAESPASAGLWSRRRILVQRAIRRSILRSGVRPVDGGFNRHITGHGSDLQHLSEPHCLEALMLVGGTLRELEVIYRVAACGFAPTAQLESRAGKPLPFAVAQISPTI
jgi:hypothetical protein